jgi:hypothetical protein
MTTSEPKNSAPPEVSMSVDAVLTMASDVMATWKGSDAARSDRRQRNMERAHEAKLDACEICGLGIKTTPALVFVDPHLGDRMPIGPECARKIKKLGLMEKENNR